MQIVVEFGKLPASHRKHTKNVLCWDRGPIINDEFRIGRQKRSERHRRGDLQGVEDRDEISQEKEAGRCIRRNALEGAMVNMRLSHARVVDLSLNICLGHSGLVGAVGKQFKILGAFRGLKRRSLLMTKDPCRKRRIAGCINDCKALSCKVHVLKYSTVL